MGQSNAIIPHDHVVMIETRDATESYAVAARLGVHNREGVELLKIEPISNSALWVFGDHFCCRAVIRAEGNERGPLSAGVVVLQKEVITALYAKSLGSELLTGGGEQS